MSDVQIQTDGLRKVAVLAAKLWDAAQTQRERCRRKIAEYVDRSLMLAAVGAPVIGLRQGHQDRAPHDKPRPHVRGDCSAARVRRRADIRSGRRTKMVRTYVAAVT